MANAGFNIHQDSSNQDQDLWNALMNGNENAYARIYEYNIEDLYSYGKNICTRTNLVEDAIQDVFTDLWKYKSNVSPVRSIKAYLFISLRRKLMKILQREKLRILHNDEITEDNFQWVNSIQELLIAEQELKTRVRRVEKAMQELSKRQKEIIYLRYFQDLSHQEIAEMMGLNQRSTYNLISKAVNLLKDKLIVVLFILI